MDYTLDTHPHPAKAVGYLAKGRGTDGDGGTTAGSPSTGEGAVGENISQQRETPLLRTPSRSVRSANHDPDDLLSSPPAQRNDARRPQGNAHAVSTPAADQQFTTHHAAHVVGNTARSKVNVRLRPRTFKFGTWNMQGRVYTRDGPRSAKIQFAEELILLEKLDLLVLTETHSLSLLHSRRIVTLCQSGISDCKLGVAIVAHASGSWECLDSHTLIDGHVIMAHLRHRRSTESFWMMAVYGDISGDNGNLTDFYRTLTGRLCKFVKKQKDWAGCFAAGDWNFASCREDRTRSSSTATPRAILKLHDDITYLCAMRDTLGEDAPPGQWTHVQRGTTPSSKSRLDRIYCPTKNWFPDEPSTLPTPWSDHYLVTVTCTVNRPKVQIAISAPRLPDVDKLDNIFWKQVMSAYTTLTLSPITLQTWTSFKRSVLTIGVSSKARISRSKGRNWLSAFRKSELSEEELDSALRWLHHKPTKRPKWLWNRQWPSAAPEWIHTPSKAVLKWVPSPESPWYTTTLIQAKLIHPDGPIPGRTLAPRVDPSVMETALIRRMNARRNAAKKKALEMETKHSSEWYQQVGDNKEADERGSRASVSVDGLCLSDTHPASHQLGEMVQIARAYFWKLHTPEANPPDRLALQTTILDEVARTYGYIPPPTDVVAGAFTVSETRNLRRHMNASAPGPDGIQYSFWKALSAKVAHNNAQARAGVAGYSRLKEFWASFIDMANDVKSFGSSRCGFKNANISMFYKKGDPTLAKNYRPISSMNTDCKLYTNMVNYRLSGWASAKLHLDQKGFIPGRYITEHTRLAYEVAHLSDQTGTNGYVVSLDQAKAYDRVDLPWLIKVLAAMGVDKELITDIRNIMFGCNSRVRINSGYSTYFSLRRGLRQGDPLSCILYNFSIEPLAMRLRTVISGISLRGLPPVKMTQFADDIDLFLSTEDRMPIIQDNIAESSFAIGSAFNNEKTLVKPVGMSSFVQGSFDTQTINGDSIAGFKVLDPDTPLRVLGVWISSHDHVSDRWSQIFEHIKKLIRRWTAIGTSLPNRVLISKALLLSRCYWLMDGNSISPYWLNKIGRKILYFVRGSFSRISYDTLQAPLSEGGMNCPSLMTRKKAYDIKLIGDLISGDQNVAWKQWTYMDLSLASGGTPGAEMINPIIQRTHIRLKTLSDRLKQAIRTARTLGLDARTAFPSGRSRDNYPYRGHPGLAITQTRFSDCLSSHGVINIGDFYTSTHFSECAKCRIKALRVRRDLEHSPWNPTSVHGTNTDTLRIWPAMDGPLGCVRAFSAPYSILATARQIRDAYRANPENSALLPYKKHSAPAATRLPPAGRLGWVDIWTDGSAEDNGQETCAAGAAWTTSSYISDNRKLIGIPLSNNIAEVAAVVLALESWPSCDLRIHTDSTYVLKLVGGGLLGMERDGWIDFRLRGRTTMQSARRSDGIFKYLLSLLRVHSGTIEFVWVKGHGGDTFNHIADRLANEGRLHGVVMDLHNTDIQPGWVDSDPVLNYMPLSDITRFVVRRTIAPPLTTRRASAFADKWTFLFGSTFDTKVDLGDCLSRLWKINAPTGLKELLWKSVHDAVPLGLKWGGSAEMELTYCACGATAPLDLLHIFSGCHIFPIGTLYNDTLSPALHEASGKRGSSLSVDPNRWFRCWWFPLLCFKRLDKMEKNAKTRRLLRKSVSRREWIFGSFLWTLWKYRMKLAHGEFPSVPMNTLRAEMSKAFSEQ